MQAPPCRRLHARGGGGGGGGDTSLCSFLLAPTKGLYTSLKFACILGALWTRRLLHLQRRSVCVWIVCVFPGLCVYSLQKHTRHKTPPHPLPPQQKTPPPTKRNKQQELTNSTRALCERPGLCCAAAVDSQALATSRGAP